MVYGQNLSYVHLLASLYGSKIRTMNKHIEHIYLEKVAFKMWWHRKTKKNIILKLSIEKLLENKI